jgi:hypothetical protein
VRRAAWAAALVVASSCKDEGVEQHRQAMDAYAACVAKSAQPGDPCFENVRALLTKVPDPKAQALAEKLKARPMLAAPLAVDGPCRALAEALGTTPEADRPAALKALAACRKAAHDDGGHDERP